jgi:hypothetical protein
MGRAVFGETRLKRRTEERLHRNVNFLFDQVTRLCQRVCLRKTRCNRPALPARRAA